MSDPRGAVTVHVDGQPYRLWLGMSVLAEMQGRYGQDVLSRLDPPADAPAGWMPDLHIVRDLIAMTLERFHADKVDDRWFVDDLLAQNADAFTQVMQANAAEDAPKGNRKGPKRAA